MCQKTVLAVEGIPVSVLCRGRWRGQESTNDSCVGFALFGGKSLKAVFPQALQGGDCGNDAPQEGASFVRLGIVGQAKKLSAAPSILSVVVPPMAQPGSSYLRHQTE